MRTFWIIVGIIVVVAVVGYGGYRVYHHYTYKQPVAQTGMMHHMQGSQPHMAMMPNSVYKMGQSASLGHYMTDSKGMTLYTYSKDTTGVSNCSGVCLQIWPAYVAPTQSGSLPANINVIKRSDGTMQYAWKGMPLYYYAKDKKPGDVTGNGIAGVWSIVK